jgi:hypothetical protein
MPFREKGVASGEQRLPAALGRRFETGGFRAHADPRPKTVMRLQSHYAQNAVHDNVVTSSVQQPTKPYYTAILTRDVWRRVSSRAFSMYTPQSHTTNQAHSET